MVARVSGDTTIEWTDRSWGPVRGCSRISPGCGGAVGVGGCYAEKIAGRFSGPGLPYEGLATRGSNGARWTGVVRLVPEALAAPLRWRAPQRIFVNSMSDLFHEELSNEDIAAVFGVMAACPQHTFQILTKRADRMRRWFDWIDRFARSANIRGTTHAAACLALAQRLCEHRGLRRDTTAIMSRLWPLPNVMLGVSVEDQQRAEDRIPHLLVTPAAVRFLSCEPLLGPVNLRPCLEAQGHEFECPPNYGIRWIIAGAESGSGARAMNLDWVRSLRDQCTEAGVAFFFKQDAVRGRKVSLPLLDGRQWVEFPLSNHQPA
jgi:protein gp37